MIRKIQVITKNFPSLSGSSKIYFFLRLLVIPFEEIDKILPKKGLILDLGCGDGPLTSYLALSSKERQVRGWDIDDKRMRAGINISKKI
ncbi:MAG: methionine biosynthesis protein MetW, partial [Candidatus Levyibacteriota bacterium]